MQRTDNITRFIDGHVVRTNPFGENRAGERAYRRAERIVAALFLLTNHIAANEPLRSSLRSEAVLLLSAILGVRDEMRSEHSNSQAEIKVSLRKLISLVQVLSISGSISLENADTMVRALDELGNFFSASQRSALSESVTLSQEEFLDVPGALAKPAASRRQKDIKDTRAGQIAPSSMDADTASASSPRKLDNNVRKQGILEILRAGGLLGIKDIASNLPEYSEKMIQRELLELVAGGSVKKMGSKRWSKYSIA